MGLEKILEGVRWIFTEGDKSQIAARLFLLIGLLCFILFGAILASSYGGANRDYLLYGLLTLAIGLPIFSAGIHIFSRSPDDVLVILDEVKLKYSMAEGQYTLMFRKTIKNIGKTPLTKLYVRIKVDAYPTDREQSLTYYRDNPLNLADMDFRCYDSDHNELGYAIDQDHDSNKEIYIFFGKHEQDLEALRPDRTKDIFYSYKCTSKEWGQWLQRSIRNPTKECRVEMHFPIESNVRVTGRERGKWWHDRPLQDEITTEVVTTEGITRYTWSRKRPALGAAYRFEWRFE